MSLYLINSLSNNLPRATLTRLYKTNDDEQFLDHLHDYPADLTAVMQAYNTLPTSARPANPLLLRIKVLAAILFKNATEEQREEFYAFTLNTPGLKPHEYKIPQGECKPDLIITFADCKKKPEDKTEAEEEKTSIECRSPFFMAYLPHLRNLIGHLPEITAILNVPRY